MNLTLVFVSLIFAPCILTIVYLVLIRMGLCSENEPKIDHRGYALYVFAGLVLAVALALKKAELVKDGCLMIGLLGVAWANKGIFTAKHNGLNGTNID